jgi:hypothetical protein
LLVLAGCEQGSERFQVDSAALVGAALGHGLTPIVQVRFVAKVRRFKPGPGSR